MKEEYFHKLTLQNETVCFWNPYFISSIHSLIVMLTLCHFIATILRYMLWHFSLTGNTYLFSTWPCNRVPHTLAISWATSVLEETLVLTLELDPSWWWSTKAFRVPWLMGLSSLLPQWCGSWLPERPTHSDKFKVLNQYLLHRGEAGSWVNNW